MRLLGVSGILALLKSAACVTSQSQNAPTSGSDGSGNTIERDVAIIGGGSAGTYAAIRLKDMSKSVVVIEKDGILGGHTDTYSEYHSPCKTPCWARREC